MMSYKRALHVATLMAVVVGAYFDKSEAKVVVPSSQTTVGYNIVAPDNYTVYRHGYYKGNLYHMAAEGAVYSELPYLMDMHGSRYEHGFDAGYTQVDMMQFTYQTLLNSVLGKTGPLEPIVQSLVEWFLDWQWNDYLSRQVPSEYKEETRGLREGCLRSLDQTPWGKNVDNKTFINCDTLWNRVQVLANLPGDILDLKYVLANEFNISIEQDGEQELESAVNQSPVGTKANAAGVNMYRMLTKEIRWLEPVQCSMMGIWGSRSVKGSLFTGRNLDWLANSGINRFKTVYVFHPEGKINHSTIGFAGLLGALTGMSAKGVTVHEANLEESPETFLGFPWLLRLRYIMENAETIAEAKSLWETTNNTVGFNHMVGSAADKSAIVMETQAGYTAYFRDDDPREAKATVNGVHTGFPLKEAVWRTNHGYDPRIMKDYLWSQAMGTNTEKRYLIIHDAIVRYEQEKELVGFEQIVNITSIAGKKGPNYFYCGNTHTGSNVLSVAFSPSELVMYAAWEAFSGKNWRPAGCNSYMQLDMQSWF